MKKKLLFLILLSAVSLNANASEIGKDYFNAVIFGDGPVADQIDEIKFNYHIDLYARTELEKAEIRVLSKDVIYQIELINPGYFREIENQMKYKNPVQVASLVNDMYKKTNLALRTLNPKLEAAERIISKEIIGNQQAFTVAAAVVAVAAAAVHNVVAVTSMAAVVIAVKIKIAVDRDRFCRPQRDLEREMLTKSLINFRQY